MMYSGDIDADHVISTMNISLAELESLVEDLVDIGFLKYNSDDEVELTSEGIGYITDVDA